MGKMILAWTGKSCKLVALAISIVLLGLSARAYAEHSGNGASVTVEPGIASYTPRANVAGPLTIAGSDTMQPLLARLASDFRGRYPDTKVAVQGGGSDLALEAFLQRIAASRRGDGNVKGHLGSSDVMLLASSRALTHEEHGEFQTRFGYEPMEIPIAVDAVAIYVHRDNPLQGLTLDQIDAMFGKDRKRGRQKPITTWGQLGLEDDWEQQPIHLYGRDKRSGTRNFFKHLALMDGELKAEVKEEPGSASEILAIARDRSAIGYAGIGFQASVVRVVPLAEKPGMPFVSPSAETATNGAYPLGRHLYLYVNRAPNAEFTPVILEFLKFINSHEGQQAAVKAGLYPLSRAQVAENLHTLTGSAVASGSATALSH